MQKELLISQIFDNAFPNGAYSHSFGFESFLRLNLINDEKSFLKWLEIYMKKSFLYNDALGFLLAYDGFDITNLDEILFASSQSLEMRNANKFMAQNSLKTLEIFSSNSLLKYANLIKSKKCHGHNALVFGLFCKEFDLSKSVLKNYTFSNIKNLAANATRSIPLGQIATQKILKNSYDLVDEIYENALNLSSFKSEFLGCGFCGLEVGNLMHESLNFRLFMS
ncbi:urease accessory protein UreF [Campylobacter corcagiensis]|uniref:Urease accessory protein UreF n=1 Tax=Campylobacter corcagiensis TaxID=1448857 RepID=A0A7M1LFI9_9BACT|nr:urease accessory UreF family protein [Campylobacter corcagiensis]QKF64763.1 urease accessory protein UreF [Campylobacter corcagiensis]QOQ87073.1 hypothetical protein IMC76_07630 [Campylobacter corcagiensis]